MAKITIYNLEERDLKSRERIDEVARAVIRAILSIPRIELKEKDIFFTFPRVFLEERDIVSVIISEESFFQRGMNLEVRLGVCRQVRAALGPILGEEGRRISVEIRRPK